MCLYPKLIRNPKYLPNKKNKGRPPRLHDKRVGWVPVGCQRCMECMKQRGRQWQVRLMEEIKDHKPEGMHFVTLTFSNESIQELTEEIWRRAAKEGKPQQTGYDLDNAIAILAVDKFGERWRAKYKKVPRHWFTTELGHHGTEHIHLHGIIFESTIDHAWNRHRKRVKINTTKETVAKMWKYGYTWVGTYVNEATVNYIIKYCTKIDQQHRNYKPAVLCSKGIGRSYMKRANATDNKYKPGGTTRETYTARNGSKVNLPMYYRSKIYTEDEREKLWIEKLEKQERWVDGSRVSIKHGDQNYYAVLRQARGKSQRLGYGTPEDKNDKLYEQNRRELLQGQRLTPRESQSDRPNLEPSKTTTMGPRTQTNANRTPEHITKWIQEMAKRPTG